jgi:hypothetical protein
MHATDLVGINDITRVLLVYTCQQGVHPRGHVLQTDRHTQLRIQTHNQCMKHLALVSIHALPNGGVWAVA